MTVQYFCNVVLYSSTVHGLWHLEKNERLWAGSSPDAVAGRKALAYGVKGSRLERPGVDAMIKGARPEILDGSVKRILMEEAKRGHGCIE